MASRAQIARLLRGNSNGVQSTPIRDGNIIISKDSLELYIDISDSERVRISDLVKITEEERLGLVAPLPNKLYFITDTNKLYTYDYTEMNWIDLTYRVTKEDLGLDQVDNTHDIEKHVAYAEQAGNAATVSGHTVAKDVPSDAVFTDTTYGPVTEEANGLMTFQDKNKLDGIESQANNYIHPTTHPASMIEGLSTVATTGNFNDLENKPENLSDLTDDIGVGNSINKIKISAAATRVDFDYMDNLKSGNNSGWYSLIIPSVNTSTAGVMLPEDKSKLNDIEAGANKYIHPATHDVSMITGLSTVATSGSYNDLSDLPELGEYHLISVKSDEEQLTRAEAINGITWNADLIVPFIPPQTDLYDLGRAEYQWKNLYAQNINLNGTNIDDLFTTKIELQTINESIDEINSKISNVDNTHDKDKRVAYADEAGNATTVGGFTVGINVPAGAKFTDTTYNVATTDANGLMSSTDKNKLDTLANVAITGDYGDLSNRPEGLSDLTDDLGVMDAVTDIKFSATPTKMSVSLPLVSGGSKNKDISTASTSVAGIMSAADKTKLDGIAENANNYTHPTSGITAGTYMQVTVDKNGHVTEASNDVAVSANGAISKSLVPNKNNSYMIGSDLYKIGSIYTSNLYSTNTNSQNANIDTLIVENGSTLNNVTIQGNLTIQGETTTIESQTVTAKDNMIVLNSGETGAGVTSGLSGIEVDRGTETNYQIVFDETDDLFKVGMVDDLEIIASRPWVNTQLDNYLKTTDISDWAKASTKPTYTKAEVGLSNVDNTADAEKHVAYATEAATASKVKLGNFTIKLADSGKEIEFVYNDQTVMRVSSAGIVSVGEIEETL